MIVFTSRFTALSLATPGLVMARGRQQIPESPGSRGFPGFPGLGLGFGIHFENLGFGIQFQNLGFGIGIWDLFSESGIWDWDLGFGFFGQIPENPGKFRKSQKIKSLFSLFDYCKLFLFSIFFLVFFLKISDFRLKVLVKFEKKYDVIFNVNVLFRLPNYRI